MPTAVISSYKARVPDEICENIKILIPTLLTKLSKNMHRYYTLCTCMRLEAFPFPLPFRDAVLYTLYPVYRLAYASIYLQSTSSTKLLDRQY